MKRITNWFINKGAIQLMVGIIITYWIIAFYIMITI